MARDPGQGLTSLAGVSCPGPCECVQLVSREKAATSLFRHLFQLGFSIKWTTAGNNRLMRTLAGAVLYKVPPLTTQPVCATPIR